MFALCETKLDDSFPIDQFSISNFICHRKDRTSHGGGLIFYVRSDIPQYRRCDIENIVDSLMTGLAIVVLEIILNSKERWLYVLGYKPPNVKSNDMLNAFNILCDKLLNESQNIVIWGDYNYDFLKQNDLSNACVSFDLHNIIKGPACSMTQRDTLLDLCLVTQPERFKKSLNLECWLSDCHNLICVTTKLTVPKASQNVIRYRSFKKFVDQYYIYDLHMLSEYMEVLYCDDLSVAMQTFSETLSKVIDHHAPLKVKRVHGKQVPYMNSEWRK